MAALGVYGQPAQISGTVNVYTQVLDVDTCKNTLFVNSAAGFNPGDRVLLIQMKGASIDTSDTPLFGSIKDFGDAGHFEFATVQSVALSRIRLRNHILRTYDITNKVQLVRISSHSGDVQTIATVTGLPWNGVTGGIIVIEAAGNVDLSANIDATGLGFRSANRALDRATPNQTGYKFPYDALNAGGWKGESMAEYVRDAESGRGPQYSGGGGGNNQNAGGGGGGNGGRGGQGGDQTNFNDIPRVPIGGLGGIPTDYTLASGRVFLGAGGGWGHENDGRGTAGGEGGGLIIIKAASIRSSGGSIISKGAKADTAANDGSGGGGAGGTVLLAVSSALNTVPVNVAGGDGGDNNAGVRFNFKDFCYGPGGGGGGGVVKLPASISPSVTITSTGGKAGIVTNPQTPCFNTTYGATDGSDGTTNADVQIFEGTVPFEEPSLDQHDVILCEGDSARPRVIGPAIIAQWTPAINISNPASMTPDIYPIASGTYKVSMQDSRGCLFEDSIRITVNPRPKPKVDGPDTVCSFATQGYTVTNIQPASLKKWKIRGGQIVGDSTSDSVTVVWNEVINGSISFESSEDGSCVGVDSLQVMIFPTRKVILTGVRDMCVGDSIVVIAEPGYDAYRWSNGDTTDRIQIGDSGTYFVEVQGGGPCIIRYDTFHVAIRNPVPPQIVATRDTITSPCQQVELDAGAGYMVYQWSTGDTTRLIATRDSGKFIVTVIDSIGCQASDTIDILRRDNGAARFTIKLDTLSAYAGEQVYYPVRVVSSENQLLECVGAYRVVVHFNRSLLVPQQPYLWDRLEPRLRYVAFGADFDGNMSATELNGISFIATLGDTSETPIVIDSFYWDDKVVDYLSYDGLFKLLGICEDGDTRYVYTQGIQYMTVPTPNPTSSTLQFGYSTLEQGYHEIILVDVMGRVVREILRASVEPAEHKVTLDVKDLAAGQYFLVMRTPSTIFKRAVRISR